ncbi:PEP-CTERM sorting domain-containing protein [Rhodopirellula sp. MGV]|uniref:PEP-CTERM sorting domain-containing protein n=1 Tax=Rhodopirellula sp. MGV TaxID=2023130 RepID=UPI000B966D12|nr:PEP-CTERM sorting domain-containing protein [Rhodopirellula sp. MGV]OYP33950.1 hypothetical protein CGZ80_17385 [Rhodopirellula sp. MGV]PNY34067.1 PEP-CTERM sorting domain-containing protein [Rhodopirellula baltica]
MPHIRFAFLALLLLPASDLFAGVLLTIQPNAANDAVYFSGTMSSPLSNDSTFTTEFTTDNNGTVLVGGSLATFLKFDDVGNFKTNNNNELSLRDGFGGFQVLSGPGLFEGLYLDDDGSGVNDDLAMIFGGTGQFTAGDFLAKVPMHPNGFSWNWNLGTYTNNSNVTILVTNTPYSVGAVPEPTSLAIFAVGMVGFIGKRRRR